MNKAMFHDIPQPMLDRMQQLERIDAKDRVDGTPSRDRLRQIPPETGRFLALLAASAPAGQWIEIGTSAGYSAMWLSLACRATGNTLTTFELVAERAEPAKQTFELTKIGDVVSMVIGDARDHIGDLGDVAFCFLDCDKSVYTEVYEALVPNMVPGGLLVVDNILSHAEQCRPLVERALEDERVDAVVVPIGKGELLVRVL